MTDDATLNQNEAARPDRSTWLSANAGSGKTRVLTDRVARLLLHGAEPQNILCLTYTRAAASEMQNRLFRTLGSWSMLDDGALRQALDKLGEDPDADLARARTLFARAIETPGGLKIQTIHSLCASILRQFPLEAGVSPQFRELDDAGQRELIDDVLATLAMRDDPALTSAALLFPASLTDLAHEVIRRADDFSRDLTDAEIFATLGVRAGQTMADILNSVFQPGDIAHLKGLVPLLRNLGTEKTDKPLADVFESLPDQPTEYVLGILEKKLLTGPNAKEPFSPNNAPTGAVTKDASFAPMEPRFTALTSRVAKARPERIALQAAEVNVAVHRFARVFFPAYEAAKADLGVLDFDDLIRRTRALLTAQSLQWVLYRLDGRIDHILVDEAQDTSPAQWQIIAALAEEMSSGIQDRHRTLFVVGDKKQSIYSFQGADAESFERNKAKFGAQLDGAGGLEARELLHSFRSSPAILNAVDAVFGGDRSPGLGTGVRHIAFHGDMPGRVDVWPLIDPDAEDNDLEWHSTDHRKASVPAARTLAQTIAETIAGMLETGTIPDKNGNLRRISAGDIMVLVRGRSAIFDQIIAACKKLEVPLAGADRLKIGSELAVRDLLALLSFLDVQDDDLSLAAALRSPLFGWTEAELFDLAARRGEKVRLWQALRDRRGEFPETIGRLDRLRTRVGYYRPYELLDRILTREGGRRVLVARLGTEAEDGIDELLRQALLSEQQGVPSLTRFLAEARASDIEVRRESDTTGGLVRVMTIHGAKGLESPIVILPDTTGGRPQFRYELLDGPGLPVVRLGSEKRSPPVDAANAGMEQAEREERDRLLYVAMTRAERWLIVCGVKQKVTDAVGWHEKVMEGLGTVHGVTTFEKPGVGEVTRLSNGDWPDDPGLARSEAPEEGAEPLVFPDRLRPDPPRVALVTPSKFEGDKVLGGGALDEAAAKKRGRQVHRLLETLPGATDPATHAARLLATGPDAATPEEVPALLAEAQASIAAHPTLFAPTTLAEVEIVADTSLGRVAGTIDRLVIDPDRILAVDFKTNAVVPPRPEDTPSAILAQMRAYLEALEKLYPDRDIDVAILWTAGAELMVLPHAIVRGAIAIPPTS